MSDDLKDTLKKLDDAKRELAETSERVDADLERANAAVEKMRFSACEFLPTILELVERQKPHRIVGPAMDAWLKERGKTYPKELDLAGLRDLLGHLRATVDEVLKAKTGPTQ